VRSAIEAMQSWLVHAGWAVVVHRSAQTDNPYATDHLLALESRRPPRGVKVEVDVRTYENHGNWWSEEQLLGVSIRYPPRTSDAGLAPEAYLTGEEARVQNYRQFARVLTWFHNPLSGELWDEKPGPGDWLPPASWEVERWLHLGIEHRWESCTEPVDMLRALPGQPDPRKLRLVAGACCRLLPLEMHHERNRLAVAAADRYAEGLAPRREMKKVCKHSHLPWLAQLDPLPLALHAVRRLVEDCPSQGPHLAADVIRDVMGNPFRPVAVRHSWLRHNGAAVAHMAAVIAAESRHDELPILADALEDAGCIDREILEHLRGPGPHTRGCWAVDALRGKG
jgi:hypothetical protein